MTTQHTSSETHIRLANFIQKDIKNLLQQQGKLIEGDKEITLRDPAPTDPNLLILAHDPHLEIRSIGDQNKSGEMYFDLSANGKQVRIKVTCHTVKADEKKI